MPIDYSKFTAHSTAEFTANNVSNGSAIRPAYWSSKRLANDTTNLGPFSVSKLRSHNTTIRSTFPPTILTTK